MTPAGKKQIAIEFDPETDTYGTTLLPYSRYQTVAEIAFVLRQSHPDFGGQNR